MTAACALLTQDFRDAASYGPAEDLPENSLLLYGSASFLLPGLMHEILALLEVPLEDKHIAVLEENSEAVREPLYADRSLIRVALLNVLHNAVKFSPDHSTLRVIYGNIERDGKPFHRVCIHDSGHGIAHGEHLRVFERFSLAPCTKSQRNVALASAFRSLSSLSTVAVAESSLMKRQFRVPNAVLNSPCRQLSARRLSG